MARELETSHTHTQGSDIASSSHGTSMPQGSGPASEITEIEEEEARVGHTPTNSDNIGVDEDENELRDSENVDMKSFLEAVEMHDDDRALSILQRVGIRMLLHRAARSDNEQVGGRVLLHHAARSGTSKVLSFLMQEPEIDVNVKDGTGRTALILASWKGHIESVRLLLCKGADILARTGDGFTCLHMAAFCGHTEVVNLLVHGKSPRQCWDEWDPSLPFVSSKRRWALMDHKSTSEKFSALHMAACGDHGQGVAIAASLLEAYRTSVFDIYGLAGNPKMAYEIETDLWWDFLLRIRDELNLERHDAELYPQAIVENLASSPLHKRLLDRYEGLVRSQVELISYSNARDIIGRTALHHAAWNNRAKLVEFLTWDSHLDGSADSQLGSVAIVNATDVDGYTPLHLASRNSSNDVVEVLVRKKDFKLINLRHYQRLEKSYLRPNSAAATPTHRSRQIIARKLGQVPDQSLELLPRPKMQNLVWTEDRAGVSPLRYAVENGSTLVIQVLLEHPDIDIFQPASDGQSPWTAAFPARLTLSASPTTESDIQRLLRCGTLRSKSGRAYGPYGKSGRAHRQKVFKQAAALAVVTEEDSNIDVAEDLLVLEMKIILSSTESGLRYIPELEVEIESGLTYNPKLEVETALNYFISRIPREREHITLLHVAAAEGYDEELERLLTLKRFKECINAKENVTYKNYTSLQLVCMSGNVRAFSMLMNESTLSWDRKDDFSVLRMIDYALGIKNNYVLNINSSQNLIHVKQKLVLSNPDMDVNNLYRDRQVYVDAANAILVGAALIASVTFAGWLQPPLGYLEYYQKSLPYPAPPASPESFAGVEQFNSVRIFWFFNSLSFFTAIATVVAGAGAVLPAKGLSYSIQTEVKLVRRWLMVTSALLAVSIFCVLGAFTSAGFASLPRIDKYEMDMTTTAGIGLVLCIGVLAAFFYRLYLGGRPRSSEFEFINLLYAIVIIFCGSVVGGVLYFLARHLEHRIIYS